MKDTLKISARFSILLILALIMLFPLLLTVSNSFMTEAEIGFNYTVDERDSGYVNLKWIPDRVSLDQYKALLFDRMQFLIMFWNSLLLVVPIVVGQVVVATMASFGLSQFQFRGRETLFFLYIITMLMPFQVTLVPNYLAMDWLGLLNSRAAIILPGIFSAFGVFLIRQFMIGIPRSYVEAAKIDGAGYVTIFVHIIVAMSRPGIAALVILAFVDYWNMVEQPLIFLHDAFKQPLSIYLSRINEGERGLAFAAAVLYMLPMVFVFLYAENDLIEGIQLSGVKG
ncbi:carbohydrate ABC transporter permease [Paenibacillus sp. GSMTC-2017]|uniref:carbohydrate ABC transporter permease n=1 Tax=Paenibacillus sp. GSMTC-2017 TaxID=2794350 RepID=UPI0018D767E0|nr:carbohydrate ABC transporter permease [Paenibacillus sp. GSMTC-2017]MBH5319036.1 carbohydrate ABC transporter permease [Paenibacillus sp. GSMTC-2017]